MSATTGDRGDPQLDRALQAIAPPGVLTGSRRISATDVALLHPEEAAAVAHAVPKRRHEFATGRALLHELIGTSAPLTIGPDRKPVLPPGVAATLAHDHDFAVAAAAHSADLVLGIDVEPATALPADVADLVLREDERGIDAHLAFTMKEAAYKAWSAGGGQMLEHFDVRLSVRPGAFTAVMRDGAAQYEGRYAQVGDRFLALVVAPAPPGR